MPESQEAADCDGGQAETAMARLSPMYATPSGSLFATVRCRACGVGVGDRDYPAAWPFDSECNCGSPYPMPVEEPMAPANEIWFRQNVELVGLIRAPVSAQSRPQLTVVKKRPGCRPQGTPSGGLLAGDRPAERRSWEGVRVG